MHPDKINSLSPQDVTLVFTNLMKSVHMDELTPFLDFIEKNIIRFNQKDKIELLYSFSKSFRLAEKYPDLLALILDRVFLTLNDQIPDSLFQRLLLSLSKLRVWNPMIGEIC